MYIRLSKLVFFAFPTNFNAGTQFLIEIFIDCAITILLNLKPKKEKTKVLHINNINFDNIYRHLQHDKYHFNDQKVLKGNLAQLTSKQYNNITCEWNFKNKFQFSHMSHILNLTNQFSLFLPEENIITKMLHKQHKKGKSIRADIDAI